MSLNADNFEICLIFASSAKLVGEICRQNLSAKLIGKLRLVLRSRLVFLEEEQILKMIGFGITEPIICPFHMRHDILFVRYFY